MKYHLILSLFISPHFLNTFLSILIQKEKYMEQNNQILPKFFLYIYIGMLSDGQLSMLNNFLTQRNIFVTSKAAVRG